MIVFFVSTFIELDPVPALTIDRFCFVLSFLDLVVMTGLVRAPKSFIFE